jgi:cell division protein FtsA
VLTGGASQLPGTRELAGFILDKQIRIGRPLRIEGAAEATGGPAFATSAGLIHFALAERAEPAKRVRARPDESAGLMNRLGSWVRENL